MKLTDNYTLDHDDVAWVLTDVSLTEPKMVSGRMTEGGKPRNHRRYFATISQALRFFISLDLGCHDDTAQIVLDRLDELELILDEVKLMVDDIKETE